MSAREELGVGRRRWERPQGVVQRLGRGVAVVQRSDGQRAVALSSVPLWAEDESGAQVPVDLSVQSREGGFGPVASAVDTRIAERVGGGVSLGDEVGFAPVVGDGAARGEAFGDKVYYANVGPDPDTDFMVAAMPTGAEALWILRSPRAGEEHVLEFSLPEGAVLDLDDEMVGGAVVKRGDEVLARVAPPAAVDADGVVVEASYRVDGARLIVDVAHRDEDLRYPIEVDPAVAIVYGLGPNGNPGTYAGWNPYDYNCGSIAFSAINAVPQIVSMGPGPYTQWCYGRWRYRAPGSAYVFEMDLAGLMHNTSGGMGAWYGLMNADGSSAGGSVYTDGNDPPVGAQPTVEWSPLNNVARRVCTTSYDNNGQLCPSSTGNAGNTAFFGMVNAASQYYPTQQASWVYGTTVYLSDRVAPARPTFSGIASSGWVRAGGSFQVASTQGGIGISALTVNFAAGGYSNRVLPIACDRSYVPPYAPCPQSAGATISVPTNASQGAAKSVSTSASTYARQGYSASRTVNIDGSGPVVDLGGRLPPRSVEEDPDATLTEPDYSLTVAASDGDPAGANSARRSGVASVEVKVDGQRKHFASQGCATHSCPLSTEWQFVSDEFTQGEHEVEVVAVDQVGNKTTKTFEVRVDHRTGEVVRSLVEI